MKTIYGARERTSLFFSISFPRITILRDGLISRSLEIANSFPRYSNSRERNSYLDSRRNKILFSENEIRGSIKIVIRGNEIEKKQRCPLRAP